MVATIWVVVFRSGNLGEHINEDLLKVGVLPLVVAMIGVGLMIAGVMATLTRRRFWRRHFKEPLKDVNAMFKCHRVPRLLLSSELKNVLLLTGWLFVLSAFFAVLQVFDASYAVSFLEVVANKWLSAVYRDQNIVAGGGHGIVAD